MYNLVADVPRLRGGGHIRISVGDITLTEILRSKAPCNGCNRRSVIKRAYHALLRFKQNKEENELLKINILMVILGAVLAAIGLVGIIRDKAYYSIPFHLGLYLIGFFGIRLLILTGFVSWCL